MTWREITADQLNNFKDPLIVDVRSPCEHEAEHIPTSKNVPLLSDDERATVGTIYKQQGEVLARRCALAIISPKIPELIDQILQLRHRGQVVVVHCWRGGLRSEAVCSFLSVIGIDCWRLTGGYKAWRQQLLSDFREGGYEFIPIVLDGLTGVGKTEILQQLESMGNSVLDLEALANHRGSIFGGMGLGQQPTQKNFDARLWQKLRSLDKGLVFIEAESRKIGRLALPDCVVEKIAKGQKILVRGSIEARAQRILDEYAFTFDAIKMPTSLHLLRGLKERLGNKRVQEIEEIVTTGNPREAVKILLLEYYDPLYIRQIERNKPFALEVLSDNVDDALQAIVMWLMRIQGQTIGI